jgi:hypothetical protein
LLDLIKYCFFTKGLEMKIAYSLTAVALVLASGCSTTVVDTNRATNIPTPRLSSTDSLATIEVGEKISGSGCATEFLMIFKSGDNKFLQIHGDSGSSATQRAKAAATYKALAGDKGLTTDIIVHPIWEITRDKTFFGIINDEVCAKVVGYRGVIKSIKGTDSITKAEDDKSDPNNSGGLFSFFK